MAEKPRQIWSGPIGALLGTDEDYAAADEAMKAIMLAKPDRLDEEIRNQLVAMRVDAREKAVVLSNDKGP